jgi:hypothetical protein
MEKFILEYIESKFEGSVIEFGEKTVLFLNLKSHFLDVLNEKPAIFDLKSHFLGVLSGFF